MHDFFSREVWKLKGIPEIGSARKIASEVTSPRGLQDPHREPEFWPKPRFLLWHFRTEPDGRDPQGEEDRVIVVCHPEVLC